VGPSIPSSGPFAVTEWVRQFGTPETDRPRGIFVDSLAVYVVGETFGSFEGPTNDEFHVDEFIRKYDFDGNEIWTRQFGPSGNEPLFVGDISGDATGVYLVGSTFGPLEGQTSDGGGDTYIRKYDVDGNEIWTRQFGTTGNESVLVGGISVDTTGVYVVGETFGSLEGQTNEGGGDAFVRKYDVDGNEIWTRQFGTIDRDRATGIYSDSSSVYVLGESSGTFPGQTNEGNEDAFIRKYDVDGNEIWTRQFGTVKRDFLTGISGDSSDVYVVGHSGGSSTSDFLGFLVKYDGEGNKIWTNQVGTFQGTFVRDVWADPDGIYVTGEVSLLLDPDQTNFGNRDLFIQKYDSEGNEILTKQFGSEFYENMNGISVNNQGIWITGSVFGKIIPDLVFSGLEDVFVSKLIELPEFNNMLNLTRPPDLTIDCSDSVFPSDTGFATAESIDPFLSITFFTHTSVGNNGETINTRTWTVRDSFSNSVSDVQIITGIDTTSPQYFC